MECTAHGPASVEFELVWFRLQLTIADSTPVGAATALQAAEGTHAELIRSGNVLSQVREQGPRKIVRSQLRMQLQRKRNAATASAFWCSLVAAPVSLLPSDVFILRDSGRYHNLSSCNNTAQSSLTEKCALFRFVLNTTLEPATHSMTSTPSEPMPSTPSVHLSISTTQNVFSSSHLLVPTMSMAAGSPLPKGREMNVSTIVVPLLACLAGALTTLCIISCGYLQCRYCSRKKSEHFTYSTCCLSMYWFSVKNTLGQNIFIKDHNCVDH